MIKKVLSITFLVSFIFAFAACKPQESELDLSKMREKYGQNFHIENMTANQDYLYGIGHIAWSNKVWQGIDYRKTTQLFQAMGVKSVRNWMHSVWLLSDPTTINEQNMVIMRDIVDDLLKYDFQIIGMNHSNFRPSGYTNSHLTTAKPPRDLNENSIYMKWLNDYKDSWYTLVSAFPEIIYWEIDNEPNYDVFFQNLMGGTFTLREKAAIYTDMMFFASQGIHQANPNAMTIMGGLVTGTAESFLELVYDNIYSENSWSQHPDDYFQIAAWHPYFNNFSKDEFIKLNQDIYNVILAREGKDKKVFITEMGWSEYHVSLENINTYLEDMFAAAKEQLPFIESIHYFRMYDHWDSTWGSPAERQFGLFTDPSSHGPNQQNTKLAFPKTTAFTFQRIAGGVGSLELYYNYLNKEE